MGMLLFIVILVVLSSIVSPIAKGWSRRIAKGGADPAEMQRLRAELEAAEQRIADAERRLQLNEERLDFQEKLLSARSEARLPPGER